MSEETKYRNLPQMPGDSALQQDPPTELTPELFDSLVVGEYDLGHKKLLNKKDPNQWVELDPGSLKEGDIIKLPTDRIRRKVFNREELVDAVDVQPLVQAGGEANVTGYAQVQNGRLVQVFRPMEKTEQGVTVKAIAPGRAVPDGTTADGKPRVKYTPYSDAEIQAFQKKIAAFHPEDKEFHEQLLGAIEQTNRNDDGTQPFGDLRKFYALLGKAGNEELLEQFYQNFKKAPSKARSFEGRFEYAADALVKAGAFDKNPLVTDSGELVDENEVKVHLERLADPKLRGEEERLRTQLVADQNRMKLLTRRAPAFQADTKRRYDELGARIEELQQQQAQIAEAAKAAASPEDYNQLASSYDALRSQKQHYIRERNSLAQTLKNTDPRLLKQIAELEQRYRSNYQRWQQLRDQLSESEQVLAKPANQHYLDVVARQQKYAPVLQTLRERFPRYNAIKSYQEQAAEGGEDKGWVMKSLVGGIRGVFRGVYNKLDNLASGLYWSNDRNASFFADVKHDEEATIDRAEEQTSQQHKGGWMGELKATAKLALQVLPQLAAGGVMARAGNAGRWAFSGLMGTSVQEESYHEALRQGLSPQGALVKSVFDGLNTALVERLVPEGNFSKVGFKASDELIAAALDPTRRSLLPRLATRDFLRSLPDELKATIQDSLKEQGEEFLENFFAAGINLATNQIAGTSLDTSLMGLGENLRGATAFLLSQLGLKGAAKLGQLGRVRTEAYMDTYLKMMAESGNTFVPLDAIERLEQAGELDAQTAEKMRENFTRMSGLNFPESMTPAQKVLATKIIGEMERWEGELAQAEPRFRESIESRIKDLKGELDAVIKSPEKAEKELEQSEAIVAEDMEAVARELGLQPGQVLPGAETQAAQVEQLDHAAAGARVYTTENAEAAERDAQEYEGVQRKVLRDAARVIRVLGKVLPGAQVAAYDSTEGFSKAVAQLGGDERHQGSNAVFVHEDGTILLNMEKVRSNTALHEAAHPIVQAMKQARPEAISEMYESLKGVPGAAPYIKFGQGYADDAARQEEAIVEFLADVANGAVKVSGRNRNALQEFFAKLLRTLGFAVPERIVLEDGLLKDLSREFLSAFRDKRALELAGSGVGSNGLSAQVDVGREQGRLAINKSRDTQNFFSSVVKGADDRFKAKAEWQPLMPVRDEHKAFAENYQNFKGNFDTHIATSIPGFRDVQIKKGAAIVGMLPEGGLMIDIGGSEGGLVKAVTKTSGGKIRTINLDINDDMLAAHNAKPVEGSEAVKAAFYEDYRDEESGDFAPAYQPAEKADVVHESMVFQFITPERRQFVREVKENYLKPDGVFITEEKLLPESDEEFWANEHKKDTEFKSRYYSVEAMKQKSEEVLVGMKKNQTPEREYVEALAQSFKFVYRYWDSGNFKGLIASDSKERIMAFLDGLGDTSTEFSTRPFGVALVYNGEVQEDTSHAGQSDATTAQPAAETSQADAGGNLSDGRLPQPGQGVSSPVSAAGGFLAGGAGRPIRVGGIDVTPLQTFRVTEATREAIQRALPGAYVDGELYEITDPVAFRDAIADSKKPENNKFGASVYVYPAEDYAKMRLFTTADGRAGLAIKADGDLVSVFSYNDKSKPRRVAALLVLAIEQGALKADAFDTILPDYYAQFGFKAAARIPWDDSEKPGDWNYETFRKWNNGRPDVVFLYWDGGDRKTIAGRIGDFDSYSERQKESTPLVGSYREAVQLQSKAVARAQGKTLSAQQSSPAQDPFTLAVTASAKGMLSRGMTPQEVARRLQQSLHTDQRTAERIVHDAQNNLVPGEVVEQKDGMTAKQKIRAATDSRVMQEKIVLTELQALKQKMKATWKGMQQGRKEGARSERERQREKELLLQEIRSDIDSLLQSAIDRGILTRELKGRAAAKMMQFLSRARTPLQLIALVDKVDKYIQDVDYDNKLRTAGELKRAIRGALRSQTFQRAANNVNAVREFLRLSPDEVSDLEEYTGIARRILATMQGARVRGAGSLIARASGAATGGATFGDTYASATVQNSEYQIGTAEIDAYTKKEGERLQALANQQFLADYQDLVEAGILDPAAMTMDEMKELVALIQGGNEDALSRLMEEKWDAQQAKRQALRTLLEYQMESLYRYAIANIRQDTLSAEKEKVLRAMTELDLGKMSVKELLQLNDAINNILYNGSFAGAGNLAVLSRLQKGKATLREQLRGVKLDTIRSRALKGMASRQILAEFIYGSTKLAITAQKLLGISDLFDAHARAKRAYTEARKGYEKLLRRMGSEFDSPLNRYRRGVYARIQQHYGGSVQEVEAEFARVKALILDSAQRLLQSPEEKDRREGELIQQVYDELLEGANDAYMVQERMSQQNLELVDYWQKAHEGIRERFLEAAEIYNNELNEEIFNYTPTRLKLYGGSSPEAHNAEVLKAAVTRRAVDNRPAGSKLARGTYGALPAGRVLDLDFDHVQSGRFYESVYDLEAGEHLSYLRMLFGSMDSIELLGGRRNRDLVLKSLERSVKLQKGIQPMEEDNIGGFVQGLMKHLFAKGVRVALGSVDQLFRQYLPVMTSALITLGRDMDAFFRQPVGLNKAGALLSRYNIIERGATQAGFNRDTDFEAIERADFGNSLEGAWNWLKKAGEKLSSIIMGPLQLSDVAIARRAWLAYYTKNLREQGVIGRWATPDWEAEGQNPNELAAAYAEQMVSRMQNVNDVSSMPEVAQLRGSGAILKNLLIPFSSFSMNMRMRLTADVDKLRRGVDRKEAVKSIVSAAAEQAVFNGLKVYALSPLVDALFEAAASALGLWDEEDEKAQAKYEQIDVHTPMGVIHTTRREKKFWANTFSDFFFSGIGQPVTGGLQAGMNLLYSMMAVEEYPGTADEQTGEVFTDKKPALYWAGGSEQDFSNWGVYAATLKQAYDILTLGEEALLGQTDYYEQGGFRPEVTKAQLAPGERQAALITVLVDLFALMGVSEADVLRANDKLQRQLKKQLQAKYGGRKYELFKAGEEGLNEEAESVEDGGEPAASGAQSWDY